MLLISFGIQSRSQEGLCALFESNINNTYDSVATSVYVEVNTVYTNYQSNKVIIQT